jgi:hypothetical protein
MSKRSSLWLLDHSRNIHSQSGEDGILEQIFQILPPRDKRWCVEFGAWDGEYLSNTTHLIDTHDFGAVLIEPDKSRFRTLTERFQSRSDVFTFNQFVGYDGSDTLDSILMRTSIPSDFDLLSIDIDGNDFHVWKAVQRYSPKVVIIEYNPTIPDEVDFIQTPSPSVQQGSSLKALYKLAHEKGYEPVSVTTTNLICVRRDFYSLFGITDNSIGVLRQSRELITHLFCGYDGSVHLSGCGKMPWHQVPYSLHKLQHLPYFLQIYPDNYGIFKRLIYRIIRKLRDISAK